MLTLSFDLGLTAPCLARTDGRGTTPAPTPTPAPAPAPMTVTRVHQEGDSITYDQNGVFRNYARWWAEQNPAITVTNSAMSVAGIGSPADAPGTNSLYGRRSALVAAAPQVETGLIGANDLVNGFPSTQAWRDALWGYVAAARSDVPGLAVGFGGVLERCETRGGYQAGAAAINTRRVATNADLRDAVGTRLDFYIPFGDATDQAWSADPKNLYDGLHPENNGRALMRRIYAAVMDPIVARATGDTPAPFAVVDQANVAPSAWVEQSFIVTGLGMGRTRRFVATDGQVARGRMGDPAFGPSVLAMNGDLVRWRVQAAAEADRTTSSTLTAGSRSATFAVRTAPATGAVAFASSADVRTVTRSGSSAPYTFVGVVFPAGRPVVALDMTYYLVAGVRVNGIALEQVSTVATNDDARLMLWVAPAGTDLPAGAYDVVVTTSFNADCVMFPAAVRGSGTATAAIEVRRTRFENHVPGDHATAVLPVPSGALSIGFASAQAGTTTSFPDAVVERTYPGTIDTRRGSSVAVDGRWITTGASRAPTIANDTLAYLGMVTMMFAP